MYESASGSFQSPFMSRLCNERAIETTSHDAALVSSPLPKSITMKKGGRKRADASASFSFSNGRRMISKRSFLLLLLLLTCTLDEPSACWRRWPSRTRCLLAARVASMVAFFVGAKREREKERERW